MISTSSSGILLSNGGFGVLSNPKRRFKVKLEKKEGGTVLFDPKRAREFHEAMHDGLRAAVLPIIRRMDQDRRRREEMVNPNERIGFQVGL